MHISVEISMYPLNEGFIPPIQSFIDRLNSHSDIRVVTNSMSTQIFGPYQRVMAIVAEEMQRSHQQDGKAAFILKVLKGDLSADE